MEDVLKEIALRPEIRDALLGQPNSLRDIFDLALRYETGSWGGIEESAAKLGIEADSIAGSFIEAVDWAKKILTGQSESGSSAGTASNTVAHTAGETCSCSA